MSDVLLGIDMGTGSSKAVVTTVDGQIRASATRPRPNSMSMPRPGWAEVDAESVWWQDVVSLCQELVDRVAGQTIVAVCVSGVGPSFLLCDDADRPLRPAILYGIDMRATVLGQDRSGTFVITDIWRLGEPGWQVWRRHSSPLTAGDLPGR